MPKVTTYNSQGSTLHHIDLIPLAHDFNSWFASASPSWPTASLSLEPYICIRFIDFNTHEGVEATLLPKQANDLLAALQASLNDLTPNNQE